MVRAGFTKGAKIERFEKALDRPTKALKQIGTILVAETQEAFKLQAFGRRSWQARSTPNVFGILRDIKEGRTPPLRRFDDRPALIDTGRLRSSFAYSMGLMDVTVGSNLDYADDHHSGATVESVEITADVQKRLGEWLQQQDGNVQDSLGRLLNKNLTGTRLTMKLPERPLVGITDQTIADVREIVGVEIFEVR